MYISHAGRIILLFITAECRHALYTSVVRKAILNIHLVNSHFEGMLRLVLFVVITTVFLGCGNPSPEPTNLQAFADSLIQANIDSGMVAGASVIVSQNNRIMLNKSYGYASLELSAPIPDHASFEIGSVTKQFTAAAILRLADEGKLSLDDDFTKYVTFNTHGKKVTIRQLLNHTSGIPGYTELSEFDDLSLLSYPRDTLLRIVEQKDFLFEPGEALIYNNTGYFLLGLVIMNASNMRYIDYLKEQFFDPLEMEDTYYCSTYKVTKNKVYGYSYSNGELKQKDYLDHTWPFAAGSLCSTTDDLLIWMRALHTGKVLSPEQYALLTKPDTLNDGSPIRYAMGIMNYELYRNKLIGHGGGINGFLSDTRYFPDANLYIICLVNTTGPIGANYFAEQLTWKLLKKGQQVSQPLDEDISSLGGTYSGQARGSIIVVDVGLAKDAITVSFNGSREPDTLRIYLGNHTWARGNNQIYINGGKLSYDNVTGHFVLKKITGQEEQNVRGR
jgi:CubicO group peptidase (beta-lactamase class C family)